MPGLGEAIGNTIGSKADSLINGPKKALLVLHYTPKNAAAGAIGAKKDKFGQIISDTQHKLEDEGMNNRENDADRGDFVMEVQYNPSSINLTASAENMPIKPLQPAFDANVPLSASVPPSVIMMIELIFDDIVVPDAFMFDKFQISMGNVINNGLLAADKNAHTVQPQTNGLLAAIQRHETRALSLYWANMRFHGEIKDMQARYTLFSVSGRPIRSVVNLTIVQNSSNEQGDANNDYWSDALLDIFGEDPDETNPQDKSYSARTKAQEVGAWRNVY